MEVDIDIEAVDSYAQQVDGFAQNVSALMGELQSAISRAEGSWHDESIETAKEQAEAAARHLSLALEQLVVEVSRLRQQAEWGRNYLSIH